MQEINFVGISRLVQISPSNLEFQQSVLGELRGSLNEPSALPHVLVLLVQFSHLINIIIQGKKVFISKYLNIVGNLSVLMYLIQND